MRPKVLCPVANRPLVDWAIDRVRDVAHDVAVNVHAGRAQMEGHLTGRVHLSIEDRRPLGTAGALGALRSWLDGRAVLTVNGDTWCPAPLDQLLYRWDGERVRVMVVGDQPLGPRSLVIGSLTPWSVVADIPAQPLGLWEQLWRDRVRDGTLETIGWSGPFADCATPATYLAANLAALDWLTLEQLVDQQADVRGPVDRSLVGAGATVYGSLERAVVWPGGAVARGERLVDAIRADRGLTVLVR
jgi:hypothetical protein